VTRVVGGTPDLTAGTIVRDVTVQFNVADRVAGAEGIPVAGEGVRGQVQVGQRAVVHVPAEEPVESRAGEPDAARLHWLLAMEILDELGHTAATQVRPKLDDLKAE
jgi:hypothetical protein